MGADSVVWERDLEVPTRDGTVLRADIWRPDRPGRYPVLLIRVPYNRTQSQDLNFPHPSWYARRGFAVVAQDTRGRWGSGGVFEPFVHEGEDGEDSIAWASELSCSNGRVGTYGFSYAGAAQLQAAIRRPEALRCLAPGMTVSDIHPGWVYNKGAFALAFNASWTTQVAMAEARRRGKARLESELSRQLRTIRDVYPMLPLRSFPHLGHGEVGGVFHDWLVHEERDEYWRRLDFTDRLKEIDAPLFTYAGVYDVFLEGTLAIYHALRGASRTRPRLLIGPWQHIPWTYRPGALDFGSQGGGGAIDREQLAFFDWWLRDGDELGGPPVRAFVTGGDRWEHMEDWPPPAGDWTLYLHAGFRANSLNGDGWLDESEPGSEDPDVFTYDPALPVPSIGGRSCCFPAYAPMGPHDQRPVEALHAVLVFTSRQLDRDHLIMGLIRARLFASTSARDTDWTVKVCDVYPDGRSINIQESIQRAKFATGVDQARLVAPGEVTEFDISVGTCAHVFQAGHRVRVEISSSNFPHWDRNLNTGNPIGVDSLSDGTTAVQTVFHDRDHPSRVVLPLID